jgi:hypothetical protein
MPPFGKSLRAEVAELSRLVHARAAAEVPVVADLVTCESRAEALALAALPPTPPPAAARIRLVPQHHTAADYLGTSGQ